MRVALDHDRFDVAPLRPNILSERSHVHID
jgi:hypothetical protein